VLCDFFNVDLLRLRLIWWDGVAIKLLLCCLWIIIYWAKTFDIFVLMTGTTLFITLGGIELHSF